MVEDSKPNRRSNDMGPIGGHLAANLKSLRLTLGLTTDQLASRLTKLGRPMHANAVTKMEKMQRRVDVDDLVALALALETRPDALLLPMTITKDIELASGVRANGYRAWRWANGASPLEGYDDNELFNAFQVRAQPPGLSMIRMKPSEIDGIFRPESEGDTSGEHREAPER